MSFNVYLEGCFNQIQYNRFYDKGDFEFLPLLKLFQVGPVRTC